MICPKCGVLLPDNITKCGNCGFVFVGGDAPDKTVVGKPSSSGETEVAQKSPTETMIFQAEDEKPIYGWLVITDGPNKWKEFRIPDEAGQFLIGKDEGCAIRLDAKGIERFHASLRIKEGKLYITDLDTEMGTYVDDEPVTKVEVQDGAVIKIGDVTLKFRKF